MSPPPHSPRWRPGPHPGAGERGTGLGPHHHHRGLHHPTHSQRRPGTWKGQRGHEGEEKGVGQGGGVPEPAKLKKARADTLLGNETKRKEGRKGENNRAHKSESQKGRGHSSQGILSPAPLLPRPCLLGRWGICSRFASSRTSSELNCTQLWSAPSILSTPSRNTYSCQPFWELSLFLVCPLCYGQRCVCVSPLARWVLPGLWCNLCT